MSIYLNTNQHASGPFEENAALAWLQAGQLSPEALACRHGASQWEPLRNLLPISGQPAAPAGAGSRNGSATPSAQAVVDWAHQNFTARVEVNHKLGGLRNDFAKSFDAAGVQTCGGQMHRWEDLQYVGYRQERLSGSPLQALVKALMYRGSERVTIKLAFPAAAVIVPAFVTNQKDLLRVLETCPAPRQTF